MDLEILEAPRAVRRPRDGPRAAATGQRGPRLLPRARRAARRRARRRRRDPRSVARAPRPHRRATSGCACARCCTGSAHDPGCVADELRDRFGVRTGTRPRSRAMDPTPTDASSRPAGSTARGSLDDAAAYGSDLSQVTDEGLYELLAPARSGAPPRAARRIGHTPQPELVAARRATISRPRAAAGSARCASTRSSRSRSCTRSRRCGPSYARIEAWIAAVVPAHAPAEHRRSRARSRGARGLPRRSCGRSSTTLPPASNSLKAHVLWHLLDAARAAATPRRSRAVRARICSCRARAIYVPRTWIERVRDEQRRAARRRTFRDVTGLPPPVDDEGLVRDLLRAARRRSPSSSRSGSIARGSTARSRPRDCSPAAATPTARRSRSARRAPPRCASASSSRGACTTRRGSPPTSRSCSTPTSRTSPSSSSRCSASTRSRTSSTTSARSTPTSISTGSRRATSSCCASPSRRSGACAGAIELPMCARPGTYVVDLIGNGMSSRARRSTRAGCATSRAIGAAGPRRDDRRRGRSCRGPTRARGSAIASTSPTSAATFVVPFSTSPGSDADAAVDRRHRDVQQLELRARDLRARRSRSALDREALASGRTARAIARVALAVAGAPASLALLKRTTWDVTLVDRHGVSRRRSRSRSSSTTRTRAVLEWPMGEDTARVTISVRGTVRVVSEQREQELVESIATRRRGDPQHDRDRGAVSRAHARPAGSCRRSARPASLARSGRSRSRSTHRWSRARSERRARDRRRAAASSSAR